MTASVVLTEMMMTVVVERGGGAVHAGRSSEDSGDAVPDAPVREDVGPDDDKDGCPAGSADVDCGRPELDVAADGPCAGGGRRA